MNEYFDGDELNPFRFITVEWMDEYVRAHPERQVGQFILLGELNFGGPRRKKNTKGKW